MNKSNKLRGSELITWGKYLESGGKYYPLSLLARGFNEISMNFSNLSLEIDLPKIES